MSRRLFLSTDVMARRLTFFFVETSSLFLPPIVMETSPISGAAFVSPSESLSPPSPNASSHSMSLSSSDSSESSTVCSTRVGWCDGALCCVGGSYGSSAGGSDGVGFGVRAVTVAVAGGTAGFTGGWSACTGGAGLGAFGACAVLRFFSGFLSCSSAALFPARSSCSISRSTSGSPSCSSSCVSLLRNDRRGVGASVVLRSRPRVPAMLLAPAHDAGTGV